VVNKQKLADRIRENSQHADKKRKGSKTGLPKSSSSNAYVALHRHCIVCQTPIAIKRDPAICGEENCEKEYESRERQRKRWNILLYVAPAIMIGALVLQLMASA